MFTPFGKAHADGTTLDRLEENRRSYMPRQVLLINRFDNTRDSLEGGRDFVHATYKYF